MNTEAERMEEEARAAIPDFRLDRAFESLDRALALREAEKGAEHSDLIWTLSLMIGAHRQRHRPENAAEAARLGERRLALRRRALADAPDELARSLEELAGLYLFEDEPMDPARIEALEAEARSLADGGA